MDRLIFSKSSSITIATNTFINVPIILQYEDTPMIQVVKDEVTDFTTQIPIYDLNGVYLAKVVGSRIFRTDAGKDAGVEIKHYSGLWVCEHNGKTLFEIKYVSPVALSTSAELYTPDGVFIKTPYNSPVELFSSNTNDKLAINGMIMQNCSFQNLSIGIKILKNGAIAIGCP